MEPSVEAYWKEKVSQSFGSLAARPETHALLAQHLHDMAKAMECGKEVTLGLTIREGQIVPSAPPQSEVFAAVPALALAMAFAECEFNMGFRLAFNYSARWEVETIPYAYDSKEDQDRRRVELSDGSLPEVLKQLNEFFERESESSS